MIDPKDHLRQAQVLELVALQLAQMEEADMRRVILSQQSTKERIAELLAAAKDCRAKHDAEMNALIETVVAKEGK